jgi:hypothetical protein
VLPLSGTDGDKLAVLIPLLALPLIFLPYLSNERERRRGTRILKLLHRMPPQQQHLCHCLRIR